MEKITITTNDKELQDIVAGTIQWHESLMRNFKILIEHADKEFVLNDLEIKLKPEEIKPFRLALKIMMALADSFPLNIAKGEDDDE